MEDTDFVVYGFLREDRGSFYYIGKGRPYRAYQKGKRTIPHPGCQSRVVILYQNITEERALENEKKLISLMGRIGVDEGGVLRNICPGGEGVSQKHSSKLKQERYLYRHQKLLKKRKNWFHCVFGEVKNLTPRELSNMYPEQSLDVYSLNKVAKGKKDCYKGWVLSNSGKTSYVARMISADWYHPEHGVARDVTIRELSRRFSFQDLKIKPLRQILRGKGFSHKGWTLLKNKGLSAREVKGKKYDWYHPEHGVVKNKSAYFISKTFDAEGGKLGEVARGKKMYHKGWRLLENKDIRLTNEAKLINWEHPSYGVVRNCSAGQLSRMYPDQGLRATCLGKVARSQYKSYKGWVLEGNLVAKQPEPVANWYNPEYGSFFSKTPSEMAKVDKRAVVRPHMFMEMFSGKSRSLRGWVLLKKCAKVENKLPQRAYKPVESRLVKPPKKSMRSKTLTKTLAISPQIHERLSEIKDKHHLRTYDDVLKFLLGDFEPLK